MRRAALTGHRIADAADFFSFDTNDLTQTPEVLPGRRGVHGGRHLPGQVGVHRVTGRDHRRRRLGRLVEIAVEEGRRTKPGLKLWVCGEHGGDPESTTSSNPSGLTMCPGSRSPGSKPEEPPSAEPHQVILLDPTTCSPARSGELHGAGVRDAQMRRLPDEGERPDNHRRGRASIHAQTARTAEQSHDTAHCGGSPDDHRRHRDAAYFRSRDPRGARGAAL